MRFNPALASALYSSALFLGQVHADDVDASESSTSSPVEKPTFTVSTYIKEVAELAAYFVSPAAHSH